MQSSTYTTDGHTQVDGRRYVTEVHILDDGSEQHVIYLAPPKWTDAEYAATMATRAAQIDAEHVVSKIEEKIDAALEWATAVTVETAKELPEQMPLDEIRKRFAAATGEEAAKLATFLDAALTDSKLSDEEAAALFGVDANVWPEYRKTTLEPLRDAWVVVQTARGV